MKVYLSELAEQKLLLLSDYLVTKWNVKVRNDFFKNFTSKIDFIALNPESCQQSKDFKGIYRCVVSKQTSLYYRILWNTNEIEVITVFDTRQNPDKLPTEL